MRVVANPAFTRARTERSRGLCHSFRREDPTILLQMTEVPTKQGVMGSRMCSSHFEILLQNESHRLSRARDRSLCPLKTSRARSHKGGEVDLSPSVHILERATCTRGDQP